MPTGKTTLSILSGMLLFACIGLANAAAAERQTLDTLLRTYERALNANDVDTIVGLYAPDGVFMPQHSPPQVGQAAIRGAYERVFKAIDLDIRFDILEVVDLGGGWAFARTTSEGHVARLADGVRLAEANQELFVLRKDTAGQWRIARYIFSTTQARH